LDITDFELLSSAEAVTTSKAVTTGREFQSPLSTDSLKQLTNSRFARKTVGNATWAVTAFDQWRVRQNQLCLENPEDNLIYLNK